MFTNRSKQHYQIKVFFVVLQDAFSKTPQVFWRQLGKLSTKKERVKRNNLSFYLGGGFKYLLFSHPQKMGKIDEPNLTSAYFSGRWLKLPR